MREGEGGGERRVEEGRGGWRRVEEGEEGRREEDLNLCLSCVVEEEAELKQTRTYSATLLR